MGRSCPFAFNRRIGERKVPAQSKKFFGRPFAQRGGAFVRETLDAKEAQGELFFIYFLNISCYTKKLGADVPHLMK